MEHQLDPLERLNEREFERQQIVENLKRRIIDAEEWMGEKRVEAELIILIIHHLRTEGGKKDGGIGQFQTMVAEEVMRFWNTSILPTIQKFSQVTEEQNVVMGEILHYLCEAMTIPLNSELLRLTQMDRTNFLNRVGK